MICSKNKWDALIKMGKKICEFLKEKEVGSIGIGAMIVFIAMVLVAGIAASVLIQTSTRLETQAMRSGQETIDEVSTGIAVFDIEGKKVTDLSYLAITVRARAGTPDLDLNETCIMISDGTKKALLTYAGYAGYPGCDDGIGIDLFNTSVVANGSLFATGIWTNLTYERFGIIVLEDADSSVAQNTPVINKGDKVVLAIRCSSVDSGCFGREIPERTDVFGSVIPEIGSPGMIAFTTPAAYNDVVYDLQ